LTSAAPVHRPVVHHHFVDAFTHQRLPGESTIGLAPPDVVAGDVDSAFCTLVGDTSTLDDAAVGSHDRRVAGGGLHGAGGGRAQTAGVAAHTVHEGGLGGAHAGVVLVQVLTHVRHVIAYGHIMRGLLADVGLPLVGAPLVFPLAVVVHVDAVLVVPVVGLVGLPVSVGPHRLAIAPLPGALSLPVTTGQPQTFP